jgi:hypothetical protein
MQQAPPRALEQYQVAQSWGFGRDPSGASKSMALPFPHRLFLLKIPAGLVMGFTITLFLLFLLQIHGFEWDNQVILHGHAGFSSHPNDNQRVLDGRLEVYHILRQTHLFSMFSLRKIHYFTRESDVHG